TATALGKLVSEGKLDWDAPISQYISYISPQYAHLTCRQFAGHTSGMSHRPKGNSYKKKHYDAIKPTVELIKAPLLFEPDTGYKYSSNAFNLLAAVIEGASGKNYKDYLQTEIFAPLDMQHTKAENINQLDSQDAQLYFFKKEKLTKEKKSTTGSYKLAGAGFRSTPSDLVKLLQAYKNEMISPSVVEEMFTSHTLKNGEQTQVGIAWRNSFDAFGHPVIEHAGSWTGARTVVVYYPSEGLTISVMINTRCQVFIEETAHLFAQAFRNESTQLAFPSILEQEVLVTNRLNPEEVRQSNGELILKNGEGNLTTEMDGFLRSNPIVSLGSEGDYALVTTHGLLYLALGNEPLLKGDIYLYEQRNVVAPNEKEAGVVLEGR
ncbi:MAG: serine hydrolase domain-containing protein, partial [Chitinophagales bacterium]